MRMSQKVDEEELKTIKEDAQEIEELFGHYFDLVIINDDYEKSYKALTRKVEELNKEPQWVPIEWLNHTAIRWYDGKTKTKNKTNKLTDKRENSNSRLNSWGLFKFWKMFLRVFDLNSWFFFHCYRGPLFLWFHEKFFDLYAVGGVFFFERRNMCFVPFIKDKFLNKSSCYLSSVSISGKTIFRNVFVSSSCPLFKYLKSVLWKCGNETKATVLKSKVKWNYILTESRIDSIWLLFMATAVFLDSHSVYGRVCFLVLCASSCFGNCLFMLLL